MGVPKQKWTPEEEEALRAGIAKHGIGKWRTILDDPEYTTILSLRSNVDLKDKWRTNVIKKHPELLATIASSASSPSLAKAEEPQQEGKVVVEEEGKTIVEEQQQQQGENMEIEQDTNKKEKKKKKKKSKEDDLSENGEVGSTCFPAMRINRIIRSEAAEDFRITQESLFLINKATEKFLEQFCEDVYANVARGKRKAVEYKHVSSAVSNGRRYDFLSDYVPEKIKVEDALSERLAEI